MANLANASAAKASTRAGCFPNCAEGRHCPDRALVVAEERPPNLTLVVSGGTFPNSATVSIYQPNGSYLTGISASPNQSYTRDLTAATAGTYLVTVDPATANTGQLTLRLNTRTLAIAPSTRTLKP